jgi:hypothetical protein
MKCLHLNIKMESKLFSVKQFNQREYKFLCVYLRILCTAYMRFIEETQQVVTATILLAEREVSLHSYTECLATACRTLHDAFWTSK